MYIPDTYHDVTVDAGSSTRTIEYVCCRDGNKRGHIGPTKTGKTRKSKHSRKLNDSCTARMIAIVCNSTDKVEVKYISSHTNHELGLDECKNLPLPNSVKEEIRQQHAAGISIERIMDSKFVFKLTDKLNYGYKLDIKGTLGKRSQRSLFRAEATRQHFIKKQDCRFGM